ncbi:alkaline phosphatase family protein [Lysobacter sp. CA199]|uniref:alkaline phosphatase family protein n=1 Tax=Lysobacter sp. CA199 TaxID=3455608 RepID=UPI003F8D8A2A
MNIALSWLATLTLALTGQATNAASVDRFAFTPNAAISGYNREHLGNVTPEQCASACLDSSRANWCVSFDYYKTQSQCDLSDKRAADIGGLKTDYAGNPYDHYSLGPVDGRPNPVPGDRHVLLIGLDGLRGDALICEGCAKPPTISALIADGAFHGNVLAGGGQATVSGPGWGSVFTGYWADQHGVTGNDINLPLKKPHVFDLIKQAYPTATTAVVADWANLTANLRPKQADYVVANAAKDSRRAADAVKQWLSQTHAPTAIFYYLHNPDIHACCYDPLNANYQQKILAEDAQIKQVLDALVRRPNYAQEQWLIVLTSDHGGLSTGHGGQSAQERSTPLVLNNTYGQPQRTAYCRGDLTATSLTQIDGATPHILDFLGIANTSPGSKSPSCGTR